MGKYLYNGVELPDINTVWIDKKTYQHASIGRIATSYAPLTYTQVLWVYGEPALATGNNATSTLAIPNPYLRWVLEEGAWVESPLSDTVIYTTDAALFYHWANYDVYYNDNPANDAEPNSLYLAASDPIPVSTAPAPDPFWMAMGWMVGRMLAGMRGKS